MHASFHACAITISIQDAAPSTARSCQLDTTLLEDYVITLALVLRCSSIWPCSVQANGFLVLFSLHFSTLENGRQSPVCLLRLGEFRPSCFLNGRCMHQTNLSCHRCVSGAPWRPGFVLGALGQCTRDGGNTKSGMTRRKSACSYGHAPEPHGLWTDLLVFLLITPQSCRSWLTVPVTQKTRKKVSGYLVHWFVERAVLATAPVWM